jgi:hypothetical protein
MVFLPPHRLRCYLISLEILFLVLSCLSSMFQIPIKRNLENNSSRIRPVTNQFARKKMPKPHTPSPVHYQNKPAPHCPLIQPSAKRRLTISSVLQLPHARRRQVRLHLLGRLLHELVVPQNQRQSGVLLHAIPVALLLQLLRRLQEGVHVPLDLRERLVPELLSDLGLGPLVPRHVRVEEGVLVPVRLWAALEVCQDLEVRGRGCGGSHQTLPDRKENDRFDL